MKVKQKKCALLPGLITVLMVVAAVAGGLRMTDPDGGRLDTMRQELETITAENEGLTAQVEALRTETAEQKALPEAIQKQKDEGFRLLGELERQIRAGESDKRIAYLTFDDGPYDNTTDAILDILKEKGVHATFFLRHRPDHVAQIQREIREGHTLANHSYSHKIKAVYQSTDSCIKEIRDQQKWLTETVGVTPEIYRFPGGSPTAGNKKQAIAAALAADGLGYVDWNCYTGVGPPGPQGRAGTPAAGRRLRGAVGTGGLQEACGGEPPTKSGDQRSERRK